MGLTRPVGVSALGTVQAELSPAGVVQGEDELPPGEAHLATAAQVRERKVGQDDPPQLHREAAHLHGGRGWRRAPRQGGGGTWKHTNKRARAHALAVKATRYTTTIHI